jgi:hypothetical protein
MSNPITLEGLAALSAATDRRLAATANPASRIRPRSRTKTAATRLPHTVYDAVSGRPVKMPNRESCEKALREALKRLDSELYASGLGLSRALDTAELGGVPDTHPLVEVCVERLAEWEALTDDAADDRLPE